MARVSSVTTNTTIVTPRQTSSATSIAVSTLLSSFFMEPNGLAVGGQIIAALTLRRAQRPRFQLPNLAHQLDLRAVQFEA